VRKVTEQNPVRSRSEVMQRLHRNADTLRSFGIIRCGIFGSFAKESIPRANSDVDLLVSFDPTQKCFDNFINLSFYLEDLLGRSVDLVTTEGLSKHLAESVLQELQDVAIDA
jgi:uncharacterized protein